MKKQQKKVFIYDYLDLEGEIEAVVNRIRDIEKNINDPSIKNIKLEKSYDEDGLYRVIGFREETDEECLLREKLEEEMRERMDKHSREQYEKLKLKYG